MYTFDMSYDPILDSGTVSNTPLFLSLNIFESSGEVPKTQ